jgi:hypothetical protein
MKILLLDSWDTLPVLSSQSWDIVVDCARSPASTYEEWARRTGARCFSVFDLAHGFEDLRASRNLLFKGLNVVVDDDGIDWWEILFFLIEADLRQLLLARRLSELLPKGYEIHASRMNLLASALSQIAGRPVRVMQSARPVWHTLSRYKRALQTLERDQFAQAVKDKFDPKHSIRRRFARKPHRLTDSAILLPSAYINVSRAAVVHAASIPKRRFLLAFARENARLADLPANVSQLCLNSYFQASNEAEARHIESLYDQLTYRLANTIPEFKMVFSAGLFDRMRGLTRWGLAIRDSWKNLFDSQPISGVLCADDSNPYSRLPLILAGKRGLPTVACHHGALDFRMAIKQVHSDCYLAMTEMEYDYLVRKCGVEQEKVFLNRSISASLHTSETPVGKRDKIIFFSEPFAATGGREAEVLRDLLPRLTSLSRALRLQLVLKLHPFESARAYRRLLQALLPAPDSVQILSERMSSNLWESTHFAITVQSSVALESASRDIPVFLCGWLADPYSEYAAQFAKHGAGHLLESPDELAKIPLLLRNSRRGARVDAPRLDGSLLEQLFSRQAIRAESLTASA